MTYVSRVFHDDRRRGGGRLAARARRRPVALGSQQQRPVDGRPRRAGGGDPRWSAHARSGGAGAARGRVAGALDGDDRARRHALRRHRQRWPGDGDLGRQDARVLGQRGTAGARAGMARRRAARRHVARRQGVSHHAGRHRHGVLRSRGDLRVGDRGRPPAAGVRGHRRQGARLSAAADRRHCRRGSSRAQRPT